MTHTEYTKPFIYVNSFNSLSSLTMMSFVNYEGNVSWDSEEEPSQGDWTSVVPPLSLIAFLRQNIFSKSALILKLKTKMLNKVFSYFSWKMLYSESSFCICWTVFLDMLKDQIAGFFGRGEL